MNIKHSSPMNHTTRFDELFSAYAESKGFVAKTGSPLYLSCLDRFNCFQTWYQNAMPLSQFEASVVNCVNPEFNVGDKVKTLVGKNEPDKIHRSHRKGSVGVIEQVGKFKDGTIQYYINFGKEQNAWYLPSELKPVKP